MFHHPTTPPTPSIYFPFWQTTAQSVPSTVKSACPAPTSAVSGRRRPGSFPFGAGWEDSSRVQHPKSPNTPNLPDPCATRGINCRAENAQKVNLRVLQESFPSLRSLSSLRLKLPSFRAFLCVIVVIHPADFVHLGWKFFTAKAIPDPREFASIGG